MKKRSFLRRQGEWAKKRFDTVGIYPLPDAEVCGFDITFDGIFKLHFAKDHTSKDAFEIRLRVDCESVYDLRINLAKKVSKERVKTILRILEEVAGKKARKDQKGGDE